MTVWEQPQVADQLDQYLSNPDDIDTVLSMIPGLFGVSDKATYLGFRALGLTPKQSIEILGLNEEYLDYWNEDSYFREFEFSHLPRLQKEASVAIVKLGFLKNMALILAKDTTLIKQSFEGFDTMSKREYDYFTKMSGRYSPADLYALDRALNPEAHKENLTIKLNWGPGMEEPIPVEGVTSPYQLIEGSKSDDTDYISERVPIHNPQDENEVLVLSKDDQVLLPSR